MSKERAVAQRDYDTTSVAFTADLDALSRIASALRRMTEKIKNPESRNGNQEG